MKKKKSSAHVNDYTTLTYVVTILCRQLQSLMLNPYVQRQSRESETSAPLVSGNINVPLYISALKASSLRNSTNLNLQVHFNSIN